MVVDQNVVTIVRELLELNDETLASRPAGPLKTVRHFCSQRSSKEGRFNNRGISCFQHWKKSTEEDSRAIHRPLDFNPQPTAAQRPS